MKNLLIVISAFIFAVDANGQTAKQMLESSVSSKPNTIILNSIDNYEASDVSSYKGRNNNRVEENLSLQVKSGTSVSRSVSLQGSRAKGAQLENLESTVGELVQKVEDDRYKISKKHNDVFESNKDILQSAYDITADVDVTKLGSEQDPILQNAFKCSDIVGCNKDPSKSTSGNDNHDIKGSCAKNQRLHWNGSSWNCIGIFEVPTSANCTSKQYSKEVNGGIACIDYIYAWVNSGYSSCDDNGFKHEVYVCVEKKTYDDNGKTVSDSNCDQLKSKPEGSKVECTFDPVYSCPAGFSMSGTYCKLGSFCSYSRELTYYSTTTDYRHNSSGKTSSSAMMGGKRVSSGYFYAGKFKDVKTSTSSNSGNTLYQTKKYELCSKAKTQDADVTCPSGYKYDSSVKKCRK